MAGIKNIGGKMNNPEAVKEQTNEIKENYKINKTNELIYNILNNNIIGGTLIEPRTIDYLDKFKESYNLN